MSQKMTNAVIDFIITFGTAMIALLSTDGVQTVSDVPQAALISAALGGVIAASKGLKTLTTEPPK